MDFLAAECLLLVQQVLRSGRQQHTVMGMDVERERQANVILMME